ncbi:MAG: hypothetical protein E6J22_13810, partial [Chloroflexi bacterium]
MRRGREHRERGRRETDHIAVRLAAAQQAKELHRVRQAQAVCIPHEDQGRGQERRNVCCPVVVGRRQLPHLGHHARPGFGHRRGPEIGVVDRRSGERFSADRAHGRQVFGVPAIPFEGGRGQRQFAHHLRVPDGGLQRDATSQGIAEEV